MTALLLAGFDTKHRELRSAQANEQQDNKVAGGLQGPDDVRFGFDPSVRVLLPVREHRFEGERHLAFHDESDKCLHARLREKLPTLVIVAKLPRPLRKLAGRRICWRENGRSNAIGVDQRYLQLRREAFVPKCGFTAAVVAGENKGSGFAFAGNGL